MKKLLKEIERGQNLDVNLSTYSQDLFGLYYKEAMVRFALIITISVIPIRKISGKIVILPLLTISWKAFSFTS